MEAEGLGLDDQGWEDAWKRLVLGDREGLSRGGLGISDEGLWVGARGEMAIGLIAAVGEGFAEEWGEGEGEGGC